MEIKIVSPFFPGQDEITDISLLRRTEGADKEELSLILWRTFGQTLTESSSRIDEFLGSEQRNFYSIISENSIRGAIGIYKKKDRS